jgi:hypothetical protein
MKPLKISFRTSSGTMIKITREDADPLAMRASIGGRKSLGYYLVFRCENMQEMENMLVDTTEAFKQAHKRYKEQNN